ncbi:AI-2E family transporter [uncultured Gemmiger sp.]|uniref:AI-2E family transporter n=1 Tax=uncultured Gemmiger sp. TaxID=1623490 RepID=UPI0027DE71BD|nr:AI-2E family transporter [uncultured Gemmiger sp.]
MIKNSSDTAKPDTPARAVILDKETARYIFRALLLTLVFAWALVNLQGVLQFLGRVLGVLSPFLMGGAFAFVINILLRPLERTWRRICKKTPEKLTRPICLTLSTLLVLGILFAVAFMMLPSLQESGNEFVQNLPGYVEKLGQWWAGAVQFAAKYGIVLPEYAPDTDLMMDKITTLLHTQGGGILTVTLGAASSVLASLVNVLLALVFALYLLAKKEVVTAHLKNLALTVLPPKNARRLLHVVTLTKHTFTNFVTGQLTEAVIIGVLCFLGMLILGIPYAGAVSAFVGATALIPVFGAWIGGVVGAFLILLADPAKSLWFVVFLLILQQVEGNLIYPKVVGKSVGLPGLLVLMAVTLGGEAFGIGGMLFSVPVCAVLYSLYLEYIQKAQRPVKDAA